jgi:two-component sensor histidine kinase
VNRVLAIAAVHEVLTEQREDDVDLGDLLGRLRAMLAQGLAPEQKIEASFEPVAVSGSRATALALVFTELLQNALEHGGPNVGVELHRQRDEVVLAVSDDGNGIGTDAGDGTGLSIVRALVRDELGGRLSIESGSGVRVEVAFPA